MVRTDAKSALAAIPDWAVPIAIGSSIGLVVCIVGYIVIVLALCRWCARTDNQRASSGGRRRKWDSWKCCFCSASGSRIYWTGTERMAIVRSARRIAEAHPEHGFFDLFEAAMRDALPRSRWRSYTWRRYDPKLDWFRVPLGIDVSNPPNSPLFEAESAEPSAPPAPAPPPAAGGAGPWLRAFAAAARAFADAVERPPR